LYRETGCAIRLHAGLELTYLPKVHIEM
jgi:hypothetical protein